MKILIADNFPAPHQRALNDAGHTITVDSKLTGDTLHQAVTNHEILIVRSTKVDASVLDSGASLKLVIRAGAGTNTIDKAHAATSGIRVCNVPGANSIAVAELVIGLLIAIDRNIADNVSDLRNQRWNKKLYGNARGLYGLTLGILGMGAIGLAVASRAHAFGMHVCAVAKSDRSQAVRERMKACGIVDVDSQETLLGKSDVISLHLPASQQTEKMVNDKFLASMKNDAILINTSRGDLVDETALIRAMDNTNIRAGLDVYQNEPANTQAPFESALANHPNVYGTHHIGASTMQAQTAVADGVIRVIESFEKGELLYCVNA